MSYVTVNDLISRWRTLTNDEVAKANIFIADTESALHVYADRRSINIDAKLTNANYLQLYKAIVCDIVKREMVTVSEESPATSQYSHTVNGYTVQGTFLSPGGGLFIKNAELKSLGLISQHSRKVELYDY